MAQCRAVSGGARDLSGGRREPARSLLYGDARGGGIWETKDYGHNWRNISDKYFTNGNIGAIAIAPSDPKVIYAGTGDPAFRNTFLTGDGMYKSTDAGKTWSRIGLERPGSSAGSSSIRMTRTWCTWRRWATCWASNPERGVFKTTDGGTTWKKILYVNENTGAITMAMDP